MPDFEISAMKGHFIHGSGTTTVYHNRALTQYDGHWPIIVYGDCDQAHTISAKATNSFVVNTTGNWDMVMAFLQPREA